MDPGLVGGIAGSVLGVLGGAFGTWMSVRNTNGPLEKAFMVKAAVVCWVLVFSFVAAMFLLPAEHRLWMWLAYPPLLVGGILYGNWRQAQIRLQESGQMPSGK